MGNLDAGILSCTAAFLLLLGITVHLTRWDLDE
jgi:hypothetical protein